jgi:hypothetical protein
MPNDVDVIYKKRKRKKKTNSLAAPRALVIFLEIRLATT